MRNLLIVVSLTLFSLSFSAFAKSKCHCHKSIADEKIYLLHQSGFGTSALSAFNENSFEACENKRSNLYLEGVCGPNPSTDWFSYKTNDTNWKIGRLNIVCDLASFPNIHDLYSYVHPRVGYLSNYFADINFDPAETTASVQIYRKEGKPRKHVFASVSKLHLNGLRYVKKAIATNGVAINHENGSKEKIKTIEFNFSKNYFRNFSINSVPRIQLKYELLSGSQIEANLYNCKAYALRNK